MQKSLSGLGFVTRGLAVAAALTVLTASASQAQSDVTVRPRIAVSTAGHGSASFDWLAKRAARATLAGAQAQVQVGQPHGRGSYVCSPAGFGRKSSCYQR
jgi:hypothetical protein